MSQRGPQPTANLVEIFSGIQGEGLHAGRRHIFLRVAGCNLDCAYCDQPEARVAADAPRHCLVERTPGRRDFERVANPMTVEAAAEAVARLNTPKGLHHAVAVTGGEPLTQPDFLAALLPRLKATGLAIMLETNGTLPEALSRLLPHAHIVSIDIKLRSATCRRTPWKRHEAFLRRTVRRGAEAYAKAVVSSTTTRAEVSRTARMMSSVRRSLPLILQPVTQHGRGTPRPPAPDALLEFQQAAARWLSDVRVLPQFHKLMGQR